MRRNGYPARYKNALKRIARLNRRVHAYQEADKQNSKDITRLIDKYDALKRRTDMDMASNVSVDTLKSSLANSAMSQANSSCEGSFTAASEAISAASSVEMKAQSKADSAVSSAASSASIGAEANKMARRRYSLAAKSVKASANSSVANMQNSFSRGRQILVRQTQKAVNHQMAMDKQTKNETLSRTIDLASAVMNDAFAKTVLTLIIRATNDESMAGRKKYFRGYQPVMDSPAYKIMNKRYNKMYFAEVRLDIDRALTQYIAHMPSPVLLRWSHYIDSQMGYRMYLKTYKNKARRKNQHGRSNQVRY